MTVFLCALSLVGTTAHIYGEWRGKFWRYYARYFGRGGWVTDSLGTVLFVGLALIQYALAIGGYLFGSPFLRGALIGARCADAALSHWFLSVRFLSQSPGTKSTPLYALEVVLAMCFTPVRSLAFAAGFALGFGAFAGFWAVSFKIRKPNYDADLFPKGHE